MKTKKSQESQRLLDSVKEKYNDPGELEIRIEDLRIGIREAEQAFVEKFPAGSRLLDIGCATGRLCVALARQGYNVTGIDVAKKQIEQAQQIAEKERVNVGHFYNMKCRLCLFPTPHLPLHLWETFTVMSRTAHHESLFWQRSRVCYIRMAKF